MAITRIQSQNNNVATASSRTVTPGSTPTVGSCQVLTIAIGSGTSSRVSSITQTNCSWVKGKESYNSSGSIGCEIWYALNTGASPGTSISISYAASVANAVEYAEYSGVATASAVDSTGSSIDSFDGVG